MSNTSKAAARSLYEKSIQLIANISAVIVAFFATGPLYALTISGVQNFTAEQYGSGFEWLIRAFWFVVVGAITFGIARATVATAIAMGGLALAAKLF